MSISMPVSIKQRIIGGVVLVVFLIFCLHMLLKSHPKEIQPKTQIAKINLNPSVSPATLPEVGTTSTLTAPVDLAVAKIKQVQEKSAETKAQLMIVTQDLQKALPESSLNAPTSLNAFNNPAENKLNNIQPQIQTKNIKSALHNSKIQINTSKTNGLVIQVGVFGVPANAKNLVKTLQKNGFFAYSNQIHTQNGQMTRVLVQTKSADRAKANVILLKIKSLTQISGIILS